MSKYPAANRVIFAMLSKIQYRLKGVQTEKSAAD